MSNTTVLTVATRNVGQLGVAAVACMIERPRSRSELLTAPLIGSLEMSEANFLGATFALGEVCPTAPTIIRTASRALFNALGASLWKPNFGTPIGVIEARHAFLLEARKFTALRIELVAQDDGVIALLSDMAGREARDYSAERMAACGFAPIIREAA